MWDLTDRFLIHETKEQLAQQADCQPTMALITLQYGENSKETIDYGFLAIFSSVIVFSRDTSWKDVFVSYYFLHML